MPLQRITTSVPTRTKKPGPKVNRALVKQLPGSPGGAGGKKQEGEALLWSPRQSS